jgi:8-oxo-dGTP diphosphatase
LSTPVPPVDNAGGTYTPALKRLAAACVFLDREGRVLLVKPTYKPGWELPGGDVEEDESPFDACIREVREEVGFDIVPERLLGVDYRPPLHGPGTDSLGFIFAAGILTAQQQSGIVLSSDELSSWRFVHIEDLGEFLLPAAARCVQALMKAGSPTFLIDGREPLWRAVGEPSRVETS